MESPQSEPNNIQPAGPVEHQIAPPRKRSPEEVKILETSSLPEAIRALLDGIMNTNVEEHGKLLHSFGETMLNQKENDRAYDAALSLMQWKSSLENTTQTVKAIKEAPYNIGRKY